MFIIVPEFKIDANSFEHHMKTARMEHDVTHEGTWIEVLSSFVMTRYNHDGLEMNDVVMITTIIDSDMNIRDFYIDGAKIDGSIEPLVQTMKKIFIDDGIII